MSTVRKNLIAGRKGNPKIDGELQEANPKKDLQTVNKLCQYTL